MKLKNLLDRQWSDNGLIAIVARCRTTGEDYVVVTQNVKETFDSETLNAFCMLRLRKDVADVTEDEPIAEIQGLLAKVKNDDLPNIKDLFANELKMNLKEPDVDARVLAYFQRFKTIVKENGLDDAFADPDGEKEKCKLLVACPAPPVLKADVKSAIRWTDKDAAKDIPTLYSVVYKKAVEHERHFQKNKRMPMTAKHKDKANTSKSAKFTGSAAKKTSISAGGGPKKKGRNQKSDTKKKTTDAEKVKLRLKLHEANKARKARTERLKPIHAADAVEHAGAHREVRCSSGRGALLHVMIHTAAGPVQLAEAMPCLIVDTEDDDFIVGRDALGALGIDVDRQIEQLASYHDDEGSGNPFELETDEPPVSMAQSAMDEDARAAVETLV
eukprot:jgi/Phyca11/17466/fgenesh1_pg.PHYCAscaffold_28_\